MLLLTLENRRYDKGAVSTTVRLKSVVDANGKPLKIEDTTPLKATCYPHIYNQIIWPNSSGQFDLLAVDLESCDRIFLVSMRDLSPRQPIIDSKGDHILTFEAFADGFPIAEVKISLKVTENNTPDAKLIQP